MHLLRQTVSGIFVVAALLGVCVSSAISEGYVQTNLVSNNPDFHPQILDPLVINAWGIALRPARAGGHIWVNNTDSGTVTEYVGDVPGTPLFQDDLKVVTVAPPHGSPPGTKSTPTGQVFSGHPSDFTVSGEGITGPSRFMFSTEDGTVSGWTEQKVNDGFERQTISVITVDNSAQGAIYKGLAVTTEPSDNHLFAVNFGQNRIDAWDKQFQPIAPQGDFAVLGGAIPKDFAPFNIQNLNGILYVTYAQLSETPGEELQGAGLGYLATFNTNGQLLHVWEGKGLLNAPWGLAIAPSNFGEFSDALLVGNFGDGTIVGYDRNTRMQLGYLRDPAGNKITIDGLWGLTFGNGVSLGRADHLYFTAGPNDESDGLFGKLQAVPEPGTLVLLGIGLTTVGLLRRYESSQVFITRERTLTRLHFI